MGKADLRGVPGSEASSDLVIGELLEDFLPLKGVGRPEMPRRERIGVLGGASPET